MNFPLQLRFKILALAPQLFVEDAQGGTICYVKQKLFRLREKVEVFSDSTRSKLLCTIQADRIIDFNACYVFHAPDGTLMGKVRRKGMRSLWSAHYEVLDGQGDVAFSIREDNPLVKVADGIFGEIPIIGLFSGYLFNPRYSILRGEEKVMSMIKHRGFLESRFEIVQNAPVEESDQMSVILSLLMFVLLERSRG
ncbi:hypothetical protein FEM03_19800 [Phragmitibacter flavus]|uniref:LURP-one-related family protein n=1 Tax=Phragmitibacter flavus TaxID=2576071 RepID=A0A5R8KBH6_9BACT|nr:hypothetical protein [Phragmitibacter flavus]TLD68909.1 hypothetical protein FEM03_19800 [Phragmitibacter flavus]